MSQWRLNVRRAGLNTQVRLQHESGLCRGWSGDVACRLCRGLGLDTGEHPCPKAQAWRLFLLAHALAAQEAVAAPRCRADDEQWSHKLHEHGLKATKTRRTFARHLLGDPRHVTVEQVLTELHRAGCAYSRTTVRKTLDEFVEWDLLQVIDVGGGVVFYDTVTSPHAHIYNVDTGELLDVTPNQAWITAMPALPDGVRLDGVQLVFRVRALSDRKGVDFRGS